MRSVNHRLRKEAYEKQHAAGRYNPGLEIKASNFPWIPIDAGNGDTISAFREGDLLVVLSCNYGLGYVGVQAFDRAGEELHSAFLQNSQDVEAYLGKRGLDLSERTIAKRLMEGLC